MVIQIDAVRYGTELSATADWHEAIADSMSLEEQRREAEILAPARGAVCGLLLSGVLWVGLVAVARALLTLTR